MLGIERMCKTNNLAITLGMLCLCLTGCGSISDYEPLGNGYIWVTYTENSISEPSAHQFELQYSPGKNKFWKKVWPDLYGGITVTNGVAVFIGELATGKPEHFYEGWPLRPRLFAVRAPESPLDITDEILWRWSKESNGNFAKLSKAASISFLSKTNNTVGFHFGVWAVPLSENPDVNIYLDWNQIGDIMREVRSNGVARKDLRWGTTYIEKVYEPESPK